MLSFIEVLKIKNEEFIYFRLQDYHLLRLGFPAHSANK